MWTQLRSLRIWTLLGLLCLADPVGARPVIVLGPSDNIALDQPRVAVEVYQTDPLHSFGPELFNTFVLDTGANGLMVGGLATQDMTDQGYQVVAEYIEYGIAGAELFDVSDEYHLDFAGTQGTVHSLANIRLLSNPTIDLNFDGILGMPVMVNRVVEWDFHAIVTQWLMGTGFLTELPPQASYPRYSVPLELVEFEQDGQLDPNDPLPTWAPLPFLDTTVARDHTRVTGSFLLDSGAQLSILSTATAIALGLDTNQNGRIDPNTEALGTIEVGGIGGSIEAPIVQIDSLAIPTQQNIDLCWQNPQCVVVDIANIPGVLGMDLFTSGWLEALLGGPDGYIETMYLDFREPHTLTATMYLDINPALNTPRLVDPDSAPSYDLFDFALFANRWLHENCSNASHWCNGADFDTNGTVDTVDLLLWLQYWLAP